MATVFLGSRVRAALTSLLAATSLWLAGCTTVPTAPAVPYTGDALVDNLARRDAAAPADKALWDYRAGAVALRRGNADAAIAALEDGLARAAAAASGPNADAAKARRTFGRESTKPFTGEPYEQVMANFYRGVLYWQADESDNARALFRNGLFIDSDTETKTYTGDWVLLEYLDGLITRRLGGDGTDALARARKLAGRSLPDYDPSADVMVLVEYGRGPQKYGSGEYGEMLRFRTAPSRIASARLSVDGRTVELPPWDDLNYQATTRGGRVMDHILGNQAVFKRRADNVGDAALVGAIATSQLGTGQDKDKAALVLAGVGILSKVLSGATTPEADTRTWDNLPQYLSFAALDLSPGEYPAVLEFVDRDGGVVADKTQHFTITVPRPAAGVSGQAPREVVVFRSELPR